MQSAQARLPEPVPCVSFKNIVIGAQLLRTDRQGPQEETSNPDMPCLTLRENRKRPMPILKLPIALCAPKIRLRTRATVWLVAGRPAPACSSGTVRHPGLPAA